MKNIKQFTFNGCDYNLVAVSTQGKDKCCNQDSYNFYIDDNQIICVMADGLGSAINSQYGAKNVCDVGIKLLKDRQYFDNFSTELKQKWLQSLMFKDVSCDTTFKFFVVNKKEIIYGGIGDGWLNGIVDGKFFALSNPDNFANQTQSMMSIGYQNQFSINKIPYSTIVALSLSTDGFAEDMENQKIDSFLLDSVREINNNIDKYIDDLHNFMNNWPIVTNQDDKSIIILGGNINE